MNESIKGYLNYLNKWIVEYCQKAHVKGIVVGISGGIDSALVAAIASMNKKIKVLGVWMDIGNTELDRRCVADLKKEKRCKIIDINLNSVYKNTIKTIGIKDQLALSNLKVRLRMVTLYALAQEHNLLVAGTGNADELYMGYFTKFGDGACDILPIAHLTKTRVFEASRVLKLPKSIIERAPSASLYEEQTDEDEMGVRYKVIDAFLYGKKIPNRPLDIIKRYHQINQHKFSSTAKPEPFEKLVK